MIDVIDSWDGGTEQQLGSLIDALDRSYFEPELYFLRPSLHLGPENFSCLLHVVSSRPLVKWYQPDTLKGLVRLFRRRRPHIVQTFFRDATYYGALAARIAGIPVVVVSVRNAGYWRRFIDRLPLRVVRLLADAWQCNSRPVAEALEFDDHVRPEQIRVLPNSIDLSRFAAATPGERVAARQRLGLPVDIPVFVLVANLRPVKDHSTLIAAAALVRRELPTARFLLVGGGPLQQTLESEVGRLNLGDSVRFLGTVADVRHCLAAADIGLLTSRSEASSNSVLEYMATGLPAIVSDIPGNRDLVDQVFFRPGDRNDLAAKILDLWSNSDLRARMRGQYRRRAMEHGLHAHATRVQSYYSSLSARLL